MSNIEVDQSGRIEMSGDTILAASDGFTVTVKIRAKVKRRAERVLLKRKVKPNLVMIRLFVATTLLAIQDHLAEIRTLTIDEEYTGYDAVIRSLLLDRIRALGFPFAGDDIRIARVGKKSPAHRAAIRVTRKQAQADKTLTAEELLRFC